MHDVVRNASGLGGSADADRGVVAGQSVALQKQTPEVHALSI